MSDLFNYGAAVLDNPWIIGIGGGILSGLIVTFITRFILSRRDNKEYRQKVLAANRDVIYAIRPGISEGIVPKVPVVEALILANARKYGVERSHLMDTIGISHELIREVMDSSFISTKIKEEYCDQLVRLGAASSDTDAGLSTLRPRDVRHVSEYRSRMILVSSAMLGMFSALMASTVILMRSDVSPFARDLAERPSVLLSETVILTSIIATATVTVASLAAALRRLTRATVRSAIDQRKVIPMNERLKDIWDGEPDNK